MATTTTNFGWDIPQSSDLVKNGATAIAELGQDIDTTMVDLKGGTAGQVLSKATNTDMDFAWVAPTTGDITGVTAGTGISGGGTSGDVTVTNSMATAIDAKGDLIAGTAADTFSRLAVGTNGQVLTADSTAATGLAWATASAGSTNVAGKNVSLNSNFSVWQRGTSGFVGGASAAAGYCADRWQVTRGGYAAGLTASRQTTNDTTNLPFIQYCVRVQRDLANASTATLSLSQSFESVNSIPLAGKTVTLSFYGRAGANYSASSSALTFRVDTGTGTDQNLINGYTGGASSLSSTATLTTTWQRFSASATIPVGCTELGIYIAETPTGIAGAADYFEVTGVQLEIAGSASAYSPNTSTYQAELAACQRYYYKLGGTSELYETFGVGANWTANEADIMIFFKSTMRTAPSLTASSTMSQYRIVQYNTSQFTPTSISINRATPNGAYVAFISSGLTAGAAVFIGSNNSSSGVLEFSAEL